MATWIRLAAWILIAFALPGLAYSATKLDPLGAAANAAFLAIGALDLHHLKLAERDPRRGWSRIVWTQAALGFLIAGSMVWMGQTATRPEYLLKAREILEEFVGQPVPEANWKEAVARSQVILTWGMGLGGLVVLATQLNFCRKIRTRAKEPLSRQPPPLPKTEKR